MESSKTNGVGANLHLHVSSGCTLLATLTIIARGLDGESSGIV